MSAIAKTTCYRLGLVLLTVVTGCMVGPDYKRPATKADEGTFFYAGTRDANEVAASYRWWLRFGDATTNELVIEALANNYDLKASVARLLQAEAALAEARGAQWPQIDFGISRNRSKSVFTLGPTQIESLNTRWQQGFTVTYVLDLFGKLRRAERAAWADMLAAQANKQALINTVIATVIRSRIEIATLTRQLEIAEGAVESRRKTLDIVERRYKQGLVGPVDVRLARENLTAAESVRTGIELSIILSRNALDVILGRRPASGEMLPDTLADLPELGPVPVGLPAALLDRRPDVIAAEMALESANERIGVSIAQLYPDLTLTGTYGGSSDTLHDVFSHEAEVYSLIFSLAQPVFRGGQLQAVVDSSRARYSELAADYAKTILVAMREVEDALVSEEKLLVRLGQVHAQFDEASKAEQLSLDRYSRGVESILTVLESERRRLTAQEALELLKGQIWTNRVNLFLALGGDWVSGEARPLAKSEEHKKTRSE